VPAYPVTPILFVLSAAVIVGNTLARQPGRALVGCGLVLAGTPAYVVWRGRARRLAGHPQALGGDVAPTEPPWVG
jgi:APA family basic amino acid/polyamine antiporter